MAGLPLFNPFPIPLKFQLVSEDIPIPTHNRARFTGINIYAGKNRRRVKNDSRGGEKRKIQYPGKCCFKRLPRCTREIQIEEFAFVLLVRWKGSRGFCTGSVIRCNGFTFRFHHSWWWRHGTGRMSSFTYSIFVEYEMRTAERFRLSTMIHGVISLFGSSGFVYRIWSNPCCEVGDQSETCVYFGTGENKPSSFIGYYDPGYRV